MKIETVLCPVDLSSLSSIEVRSAVEVCTRFGARLVLEHNVDPTPPASLGVGWMWSESHEAAEKERERVAREGLRQLLATLPESVRGEGVLSRGPLAPVLLELARDLAADLIVMASHGKSTPEHKSFTEQLLVKSGCPLLAAQGQALGLGEGAEVLVAVDFSTASRGAIDYAVGLAEKAPLKLVVFHVETPAEERVLLEKGGLSVRAAELALGAAVPPELGDRAEFVLGKDDPAAAILDFARSRRMSAVVMGLHTHGVLSKHLSARALEVLHESPCPVWFVPVHESQAGGGS
jgi:nucleotide-binding universal stress UspA family protein